MEDKELEEHHEDIFSQPKKRDEVDLDEESLLEHTEQLFGPTVPGTTPRGGREEEDLEEDDDGGGERSLEEWHEALFGGGRR